jgi:hypothetical protein
MIRMNVMKTLTINGTTYKVSSTVPTASVTLLASEWVGDGDHYSQAVEIPGVTARSKVDLQPTDEQLVEFHHKVLAFTAKNSGGVVTVHTIGDKPLNDHTIQVTLTEVDGADVIQGNTVGTSMPRPDWNQTDPRKADYIKNKPNLQDMMGAVKTVNGFYPDENGNVNTATLTDEQVSTAVKEYLEAHFGVADKEEY